MPKNILQFVIQGFKCPKLPHHLVRWNTCSKMPIKIQENFSESLQKVVSEMLGRTWASENLDISLAVEVVDMFLTHPGCNIGLGSAAYPKQSLDFRVERRAVFIGAELSYLWAPKSNEISSDALKVVVYTEIGSCNGNH